MSRRDNDPHNDGRTVAMLYVDRIDTDQDSPGESFEWCPRRSEWRTKTRVETAQTTWITLQGRSVDQWYRRDRSGPFEIGGRPGYVWLSVDGGTPAPELVVRALDDALIDVLPACPICGGPVRRITAKDGYGHNAADARRHLDITTGGSRAGRTR